MKKFVFALIGLVLAATTVSAQSNYRIKPGDTVSIEVLEDTSLNRQLLVLPDGTVNFPFAGAVKAGGRTPGEVQQALVSGISSNFASPPTVFVTVSSVFTPVPSSSDIATLPDGIDVYFLGEVNGAGLKPMAPGTTFLQAMAQSGGFSQFAATKRVQLRRTDPRTGKSSVYTINYRALSNGAQLQNNVVLQDGDVILVPERRLFE